MPPPTPYANQPLYVIPGRHRGMVRPGNIDLARRKIAHNKNGSISTVDSISINVDGREVLIPRSIHGKVRSIHHAVRHYRRTGKNLGVFKNPRAANRYAIELHKQQAHMYGGS